MASHSVRSRPADAGSAVGVAVRDCLTARGWQARLVHYRFDGEADVRVRVCSGGGGVAVELLLPSGPAGTGECWQAVRISPAGRAVWTGPPPSCPLQELLAFVEALAAEVFVAGDDPPCRYRRLG